MHRNEASDLDPESAAQTSPTVLRMSGTIDYTTVAPMADRIAEVLAGGCVQLVLDMSEVGSLSGGALGALLLQQTDAEELGGSIKVAGPNRTVFETLKTNGFTAVFDIFETTAEAIRSFGHRQSRVA